jgi:hypothetical protein
MVEYFQKRERYGHSFKRTCWTYFEYPHFFCGLDIGFRLYNLLLLCCHYLPLDFVLLEKHGFILCHIARFIQIQGCLWIRLGTANCHHDIPYLLSQDGLIQKLRISFRGLSRLRFDRGSMLIDYTNASKCGGVQEEHSHWGQMLLAMPQFVSRGTIASIALAMWSFLYWNFTKTLLVSPDHCNLKSHSMTLQCCGPFWKSLHNMFGSCFEITKILISKSDT